MYLQQDITGNFFEDIAWNLATGSNRAFFTTGDAGIGKSLLTANVAQITSWIAEAVSGQPIPFTVDSNLKSDITDFIKMLSNGKSYHSYLLDELLAYHGQTCFTPETKVWVHESSKVEAIPMAKLYSPALERRYRMFGVNPNTNSVEYVKGLVYPTGKKECLRMTFDDDTSLTCTKAQGFFKFENGKIIRGNADQLQEGDTVISVENVQQ